VGNLADRLIRRLERLDRMSPEEKETLNSAIGHEFQVASGQEVIREGSTPKTSALLLEGLVARCNSLLSGQRQITAVHVPGDFVDLHAFLMAKMDHSVVALTPCRFGVLPHEALDRITTRLPHLTKLLWLTTLVDGAVHRAWLTMMGRMSSHARVAHLVCELYTRLKVVGLAPDQEFEFPLTQETVADMLGLSTVHVNRSIQQLRKEGLIVWKRPVIAIPDWDRLVEVAEFDPTYLNLEGKPL
jgi:CRP-like cAMP-binding protein